MRDCPVCGVEIEGCKCETASAIPFVLLATLIAGGIVWGAWKLFPL